MLRSPPLALNLHMHFIEPPVVREGRESFLKHLRFEMEVVPYRTLRLSQAGWTGNSVRGMTIPFDGFADRGYRLNMDIRLLR